MEFHTLTEFNTDNITQHPFIKDMGGHTWLVADNVLHRKIDFFAFKSDISEYRKTVVRREKSRLMPKILDNYLTASKERRALNRNFLTFDCDSDSVIDRAVELGVELDFEVMQDSYIKTTQSKLLGNIEEHLPFDDYMASLEHICALKVLESKVLSLFIKDIEAETASGSISLLSAIQSDTDALYIISQTDYAYAGKNSLRKHVDRITRLADNDKISSKHREDILSQYLNLPMTAYEIAINNMIAHKAENMDELCSVINTNLAGIVQSNHNLIEELDKVYNSTTGGHIAVDEEDENTPYVANEDYVDPSIY